jgi:hypothetical protein
MAFDPLSSDFIESSLHHQKESLELIQSMRPQRARRGNGVVRQPRVPKVRFFMSKELRTRIKTLKSRQLEGNIVTKICDDLLSIKKVPEDSINYLGLSNDDFSKISYLSPDRKERVEGKTFIDKYITPSTNFVIIYEQQVTLMDKDSIHQDGYRYVDHTNKGQDWRKFPQSYFKDSKEIRMNRRREFVEMDENNVAVYRDYYTVPNLHNLEGLTGYRFDEEGNIQSLYGSKTPIKWFLYNLKSATVDSCWDHNMRHHQSIHKILTKLLGNKYTEREKNIFSEQYFKLVVITRPDINLKIVDGEDLIKYYEEVTYYKPSNSGTLWNSCMRYSYCSRYVSFYNDIPIKMAVLLYKNYVVARSLLWESNNQVYYDRVYSYNAEYEGLIENLLEGSNYKNLREGNSSCASTASYIEVPLPSDIFCNADHYPYVDSLKYYSPSLGILSNKELSDVVSDVIVLDRTDGSYTPVIQVVDCDMCGRETDPDDLCSIERGPFRGDCGCDNCAIYSEEYSCYISRQDSVFCEFTCSYILEDDAVEVPGGICYYSHDNLSEYENGYGHFVLGEHDYVQVGLEYYHPNDPNIPREEEEEEEEQEVTYYVTPNEVNASEEVQEEVQEDLDENLDILL